MSAIRSQSLPRARRAQTSVRTPFSAWQLTLATSFVGAAATLLVVLFSDLRGGYRSSSLHEISGTVDACIAALCGYLMYGRLRRRRRRQDLILLQGLLCLAIASPALGVLTAVGGRSDVALTWFPLVVRTAGAVLIAIAALVPRSTTTPSSAWWSVVPAIGSVLLALAVVQALPPGTGRLPVDPARAAQMGAFAGTALYLTQVFGLGCFLVAAIAFTRQATRHDDEFVRWLGPACALGVFARVNYVLFPSIYTTWLYTGDIMRTSLYLLLAVGAAREIGQYWQGQAKVAVSEDRERLARELHDGVVQEIGYARAQSHAFQAVDLERANQVIDACDRALDEARQAIETLGRHRDEPFSVAVARAVHDVAERYHLDFEMHVDDSVTVSSEERHDVLRILREALANAARHGKSSCVTVELTRDSQGRHLVVRDDGVGFDVPFALTRPGSYGLTSMRERAEKLGASFSLDSSPGSGTSVSVTLAGLS
jgi:signal transduction histidine kinase